MQEWTAGAFERGKPDRSRRSPSLCRVLKGGMAGDPGSPAGSDGWQISVIGGLNLVGFCQFRPPVGHSSAVDSRILVYRQFRRSTLAKNSSRGRAWR